MPLCAKCHQNEATIHFTTIVDGKEEQAVHLCGKCASDALGQRNEPTELQPSPANPTDIVGEIPISDTTPVDEFASLLVQKRHVVIADAMELGLFLGNVKESIGFDKMSRIARKYGLWLRS